MENTVYTTGAPGEMGEIIDFINYIFSQTKVPHDFKKLLPKVYGDGKEGYEAFHFLAKQNGKIVGCIADRPTELNFGGDILNCGYVGSVSVHPYHRGEGHMKRLMADVISDARAKGRDMLILGGQRQRYGYFGFEPAGLKLVYSVTKTNLRHALSNVDDSDVKLRMMTELDVPEAMALWQRQSVRATRSREGFLDELRSWSTIPVAVEHNGAFAGYIAGHEVDLSDEKLMPKAIKKYFELLDEFKLSFEVPLHDRACARYFGELCENSMLGSVSYINVLNWPNVLKTLLGFKHKYISPVNDGKAVLDIENDGIFEIEVRDGEAVVMPLAQAPKDAVRLNHNEAERLFFGLAEACLDDTPIPLSWKGLPFFMSEQDAF